MHPDRICALLTVTMNACAIPTTLRYRLAWRAFEQLQQRYPLAGCGVTQEDGTIRIIEVGLN